MQSRSDDTHFDMQDVGVSEATRQYEFNWTRLAICQTDTDEPLQCPAVCGAGAGYQPFAEILLKYQAADALLAHVDPADFDECSDMSTLPAHNAKWRKSCRLHFYSSEL